MLSQDQIDLILGGTPDNAGLAVFYTKTAVDAAWPYLIDRDACEIREIREEQKMVLARYARQSLLQWSNVRVTEIRDAVERLHKLISNEPSVTRMTEG